VAARLRFVVHTGHGIGRSSPASMCPRSVRAPGKPSSCQTVACGRGYRSRVN
jgi:hypothetical protein